ncbi:hypothetical protein B0H13DRAFT_1913854 [Mycena leptocephala]|nr:hypothetical protein B0H13DRAFT_1913854 [Mycena leptocephala]
MTCDQRAVAMSYDMSSWTGFELGTSSGSPRYTAVQGDNSISQHRIVILQSPFWELGGDDQNLLPRDLLAANFWLIGRSFPEVIGGQTEAVLCNTLVLRVVLTDSRLHAQFTSESHDGELLRNPNALRGVELREECMREKDMMSGVYRACMQVHGVRIRSTYLTQDRIDIMSYPVVENELSNLFQRACKYDAECLLLQNERIRAPAADIPPSGPRRQEGEPLDAICRCGNWLVGTTVVREAHSERHTIIQPQDDRSQQDNGGKREAGRLTNPHRADARQGSRRPAFVPESDLEMYFGDGRWGSKFAQ